MKPGSIIEYGNYYLTRKIAVGGMAELFRARKVGEAGFEKLLVIKRLLSHLAADQELRDMFLDEARLASQLTHQNIAQVYDLGRAQEMGDAGEVNETTYFIAMEYIFGKSLAEIFRRSLETNKFLTSENVVKIIISAALGLEYAHSKKGDEGTPLGIVHRDVSPQNILVSYEGEVKLVDFGIAKALSQSQVTRPGVLKGKFSYMAPEQAKGQPVDARADIYALGVVFWETLAGQRLFTGQSETEILAKVASPQVEAPSSIKPDLPKELDSICLRCLAVDPQDRYQDLKELASDLESYLQRLNTYPSSYALRNHMHEIFAQEVKEETQQIQQEIEAVRRRLTLGPGQAAPGEKTVIFKQKSGKVRKLAMAGGAVAVAAGLAVYLLAGGPASRPKPPVKPDLPPVAQTAPEKPVTAPPVAEKQAKVKAAEKPKPDSPAAQAPAKEPAKPKETQVAAAPAPPAQAESATPPAPQEPKPPSLLTQAQKALAEKDYDQALTLLGRLEKEESGAGGREKGLQAKALVGRAMQGLEESPQKSLQDLERAAQLDPNWGQIYFQTGRAQTRLKKLSEAMASYNKALELDPKLDGAFFNRGYLYLTEKRFTEAVQDFQRVVDLGSPYKSDAYLNMGVCYFQLGNRSKALQMLEMALKTNPENQLAKKYIKQLKKLSAKQGSKAGK